MGQTTSSGRPYRGLWGVYALFEDGADPDDPSSYRYVGKGRLPSRPMAHGLPSTRRRYGHLPVVCWIVSLTARATTYRWVALEYCSKDDVAVRERAWISAVRSAGAKLLNCTDGGEGMLGWTPTDALRHRRASTAVALWQTADFRDRMCDARRRRWQRKDERLSQAARMGGGRPFVDGVGNRYDTLGEAARALGLSRGNVAAVLKGRYRHTGGHTFRYI